MAELAWMEDIRMAAAIARTMSDTCYGYYMRLRAPSPGAQPPDELSSVALAFRTWHEGICEDIWGWVCYAKPLTDTDVKHYDLLPDEDNPCRYQQYGLVRYEKAIDDSGQSVTKRIWVMENGKIYQTSYPGAAFAKLDVLNKQLGADAVKLVKIVPKTTDEAPT